MNQERAFNEVKAKSLNPFENDNCRALAYDVGVITILFGNLEAVISFYIGVMLHDPTGAMYGYAERLQYVDRVGLFCDLVVGRCPEYKAIVGQLKRDLKKIAEQRNIVVHNGIKTQGDKLLLKTLRGKSIEATDLSDTIRKLQDLSDRVATVWLTLCDYEAHRSAI